MPSAQSASGGGKRRRVDKGETDTDDGLPSVDGASAGDATAVATADEKATAADEGKGNENKESKRRFLDENNREANDQLTHVDDGPAGEVAEAAASAGASADPEVNGTCIICLDNDPPPIQSGCACRGDAGLGHVVEAAAHRMTHQDEWDRWWKCGTCGQEFTGAMQLGLADEWWSRVQSLPEEDDQRLVAGANLADALDDHGRYSEAEASYREVLVVRQSVLGCEHPSTLATACNLATTLSHQGKYAEAEATYREVLVVQQRVLGSEHPDMLRTACNLASALGCQGKHVEAEAAYREVLVVQQRVLGSEHLDTLATACNLASALDDQRKHVEAEAAYREVLVVQQRVLGSEHPHTLVTARYLASCIHPARDATYSVE